MGMFGWSLPAGCGSLPGEEADPPCAVCGLEAGACICPECLECGEQGNPQCYADKDPEGNIRDANGAEAGQASDHPHHGLRRSQEQIDSLARMKAEWDADAKAEAEWEARFEAEQAAAYRVLEAELAKHEDPGPGAVGPS